MVTEIKMKKLKFLPLKTLRIFKMKKVLILLILAIFAIIGINGVSASFSISSGNMEAEHNRAVSGSFILSNTDLTASITNISCSVSAENWTSAVSCPSSIIQNSSQTISFVVNVPQYISSGTYAGTINVQGIKSGSPISQSKAFSINVKKTLDLSLSRTEEIFEIYEDEEDNITIRVRNTGNIPIDTNFSIDSSLDDESFDVSQQIGTLYPSAYSDIKIKVSPSEDEGIGSNNILFKITGHNETATIERILDNSFDILYQLCEVRESGDISLYDILNDEELEDTDFMPLETMEIELKVRNNNDDEKKYARIKAVLVKDNDIVDDAEAEDKIRVDTLDTMEAKLEIDIPADVEEGIYYLYVSAYDDDDEDNCEQKMVRINIEKRTREAIPYNVKITPSELNCTDEFVLTGNIMNTGRNDEEQVKVIYKDSFGNEDEKVFNDLDEGEESSSFSFNGKVPENAEEGKKLVTLSVYYDYDDNDEDYDEIKSFEYYLEVEGNCKNSGEFSTISQITGFAGKNIYATITIKNTGEKSDFEVTARSNWADILSVEPSVFNLEEDETKNVLIKLNPNSGISEGMYNVDVEIKSGEKTEEKTISVYIQESEFFGEGFLENFKSKTKEGWFWVTAVSVLILILVALIVYFFVSPSTPNVIRTMSNR